MARVFVRRKNVFPMILKMVIYKKKSIFRPLSNIFDGKFFMK